MEQLIPGVYALELEHEFMGETRSIHPAAIETEHGIILIDVGLPGHLSSIEANLKEAGFQLEDIEIILITHQDADHAGALDEVTNHTNATVAAHVDDAPYIEGARDPIKGNDRYPSVPVDIEVVDSVRFLSTVGKIQIVATPGHTPGHISIYIPQVNLLIAADALTAEDSFGGPNEDFTPDMDAAIDSIGRLAVLDVERTLCFHGGLVEHDTDRIETIHASLQD